jgi:hypothetical protein
MGVGQVGAPPVGLEELARSLATAPMSRGDVLRRGAVAAGAVAGAGLLQAAPAFGLTNPAPRPIPGGFDENFKPVPRHPFIHVLPPSVGFEMSTITDFHGTVAAADVRGLARGSDGSHYWFDADMRFMRGTYVALDGGVRKEGSFGFI